MTPDSRNMAGKLPGDYFLKSFRYGPKKLQILAHCPGGLPAAFRRAPLLLPFLVPVFFMAMFWQTLVQTRHCDIIHAHWTINGIIASIVGRVTCRSVVTTLRGDDVNRAKISKLHRFLLYLCLRFSDSIVTVSKAMYESLIRENPKIAKKINFIPNGISESLFAVSPRQNINEATLLTLGSLVPVKGIEIILKALGRGCSSRPWKLLIAGEGPEKKNLQQVAKFEGIEDKVQFIGQVMPSMVANLMAQTDIYIQASYREGRPNAMMEAMAAGVPVIGSDIDGINELITHDKNGLLFSVGNVNELARQFVLLLGDTALRKRLGRAGRQTLLDQGLTWSGCASAYATVYRHLIGEKK